MSQQADSELTKFTTGAVRSTDANKYAYHLISPIGLRRLAETYREGSVKYGDLNCEMGMPISDLLNHVLKHIYDYLGGSRAEDDLAHAAWGLMMCMHSEEKWPHLNTDLRGPGCELTSEQRQRIAEANAKRAAAKAATADADAGSGLPDTALGVQESPFDRQKATGRLSGVRLFDPGVASDQEP